MNSSLLIEWEVYMRANRVARADYFARTGQVLSTTSAAVEAARTSVAAARRRSAKQN